jgi:hypothetical protein
MPPPIGAVPPGGTTTSSTTTTSSNITKAVVSSTGDPHIRIKLDAGKQQVAQLKYNDQAPDKDLVNTAASSSLGAIYVGTTETTPNKKNGVTYNDAVQIYDASGNISVSISTLQGKNGELTETVSTSTPLPKNVTVDVTTNKKGDEKVTFDAQGADGQSFQVVVTENKHGLNVKATAYNTQIQGSAVDKLASTILASA